MRHIETSSTAELVEHTSTEVGKVVEEVNAASIEQEVHTDNDRHHEREHEDEMVDIETVDEEVEALAEKVTAVTTLGDETEDHKETTQEDEEGHGEHLDVKKETKTEVVEASPTPATRPISSPVNSTATEKVATGVPQRAVLSGIPAVSPPQAWPSRRSKPPRMLPQYSRPSPSRSPRQTQSQTGSGCLTVRPRHAQAASRSVMSEI